MKKEIKEYLRNLGEKWRIIVIAILIGVIFSSIYAFFISKPVYEAEVKVFIGKEKFKNNGQTYNSEEIYNNDEVTMYQNLIKTHSELLKSKDLIKGSIKEAKSSLTVEDVLSNLSIAPVADSQILKLTYKDASSQKAYDMLYAITNVYIEVIGDLYPKVNIQVLEQVSVGTSPVNLNSVVIMLFGAVLGAVLGIGITLLSVFMNNTFTNKEEIENTIGLPVIGLIPLDSEN